MADVVAPEPQAAEKTLLERQHHGEAIHRRGQPPGPARPPCPELGRDVVEHLGSRLARRFGHTQVKAGIVDQDDEIVPAGAEFFAQRAEEPDVGAELGDDLHQSERREPFDGIADHGARFGHAGASRAPRWSRRDSARAGRHDARAVKVTRWLAGGNEDAGGGSAIIRPRGRQAARSGPRRPPAGRARAPHDPPRRARPRPRSPRTAWTKLCSSRPQGVGLRRLQHDPLDHVGQRLAGAGLPPGPHPHELPGPAREIEREVAVGLEETQLADPLARHAARRWRGRRRRWRTRPARWRGRGGSESSGRPEARTSVASAPPVRCSTRSRS